MVIVPMCKYEKPQINFILYRNQLHELLTKICFCSSNKNCLIRNPSFQCHSQEESKKILQPRRIEWLSDFYYHIHVKIWAKEFVGILQGYDHRYHGFIVDHKSGVRNTFHPPGITAGAVGGRHQCDRSAH